MTALPIHPSELIPSTLAEVADIHARLMDPVAAAEVLRREKEREARETEAKLAALEAKEAAERARRDAEASHVAELVAKYRQILAKPTPRQIIAEVAVAHDLPVREVIGQSRKAHIVRARQHAMYRVAVECPRLSYKQISSYFSNRDHSTTIWGIQAHALRHELVLPERRRDSRGGYVVGSPAALCAGVA